MAIFAVVLICFWMGDLNRARYHIYIKLKRSTSFKVRVGKKPFVHLFVFLHRAWVWSHVLFDIYVALIVATYLLQICFVNCWSSNTLRHLIGCVFSKWQTFYHSKNYWRICHSFGLFLCVSMKNRIYITEAVCGFVCGIDSVCVSRIKGTVAVIFYLSPILVAFCWVLTNAFVDVRIVQSLLWTLFLCVVFISLVMPIKGNVSNLFFLHFLSDHLS